MNSLVHLTPLDKALSGEPKAKFFIIIFIMFFNTPSACGGVLPLNSGPGLALGFNTLYLIIPDSYGKTHYTLIFQWLKKNQRLPKEIY